MDLKKIFMINEYSILNLAMQSQCRGPSEFYDWLEKNAYQTKVSREKVFKIFQDHISKKDSVSVVRKRNKRLREESSSPKDLTKESVKIKKSKKELALHYLDGIGVPKDQAKAFKLFKEAAEEGEVGVENHIGLCYLDALGVPQDYQQAFQWFSKAADKGEASGNTHLGVCYQYGFGVNKDLFKAVEYFKIAARSDDKARNNLAVCYLKGEGVKERERVENEKKAFMIFLELAKENYTEAKASLALCYLKGKGVGKDKKEGVRWLEKAVIDGHTQAKYSLGICYLDGDGVQKDTVMAFKWLKDAADKGYRKAKFVLARCYEHGIGVERDLKKSIKWYQQVANEEAVEREGACAATKKLVQLLT